MKSISLSVSQLGSSDSGKISCPVIDEDLARYIMNIASSEYEAINIIWICEPTIENVKLLKRIQYFQKRLSQRKRTMFRNTLRIIDEAPEKRILSFIRRCRFAVELAFSDYELCRKVLISQDKKSPQYDVISITGAVGVDFTEIYETVKPHCHVLKLKQNFIAKKLCSSDVSKKYTSEISSFFDYWLKDANGIHVKPITDYVRNSFGICMEKECIAGSCLGKILDIDSDGNIRLCPHSDNDMVKSGNIKNFSLISEVFETDKFKKIVTAMIEKRKKCVGRCQHFDYCQGGCCIESLSGDICGNYCDMIKSVNEYICSASKSIVGNGEDLFAYNPVLSDIVKEAISCNPEAIVRLKK